MGRQSNASHTGPGRAVPGLITSRDNPVLKELSRLLTDASYRRESGLFALEGARLCADAAASGVEIRTVLYTARARAVSYTHLNSGQKSYPIWRTSPHRNMKRPAART